MNNTRAYNNNKERKMRISRINIKNFRKLENVEILLDKETTLLVGANNSGKTSAIEALCKFFQKDKKKFVLYDWTISNWDEINEIGQYIEMTEVYNSVEFYGKWIDLCPTLDLWFHISEEELHHVIQLIPTLDWTGGMLGIRFSYEPKLMEELFYDYKETIRNIKRLKGSKPELYLWPNDLCDFLKKKMNSYFSLAYYTLDPIFYEKSDALINSNLEKLDTNPLRDLVKIDVINAQRGFSDSNGETSGMSSSGKLSKQLRNYFDNQLSPQEDLPEKRDLGYIEEVVKAQTKFDIILNSSFEKPIEELRSLGYPGFTDPKIHISTKMSYTDSLDHSSAVQYSTTKKDTRHTRLPEDYTGLGYQNLISMVFKLMSFRDEWMSIGSRNKLKSVKQVIQPLHFVVIEEPEAHLHTQVQQVFINKAYKVLRNHKLLKENQQLSTQLLVSTHSSYIIEELDFSKLRYFRRLKCDSDTKSPKSEIINCENVFGEDNETTRFVSRYIKTTHCDLFFADAAILIEGSAERMLLPEFMKRYPSLESAYLTILEIGGSHAFRLKPLIDLLGICTLVISDLDPCKRTSQNKLKKVLPEKGKGYETKNNTLIKWAPKMKLVDDLITILNVEDQEVGNVFVTYQKEIKEKGTFSRSSRVIPSTFEDALVIENTRFFLSTTQEVGPTKKVRMVIEDASGMKSMNRGIYTTFSNKNFKKAEFSLDVLLAENIKELKIPTYIDNGLSWLESKLVEWNHNCSFEIENGDRD